MAIYLNIIVFVFGTAVGSFLNVVINRLYSGESIFFSRSRCPKCKRVINWFALIPLVSFIVQEGKCRKCGKKISWQYPAVELTTGILFLLVFNYVNILSLSLFYYWYIVAVFIIVFVYDLKHYIIPDKIIVPAMIVSLLYLGAKLLIWESDSHILAYLLSGIMASGFFFLLVAVSKGKWMGLGDVKLVFLMSLVLGWPLISVALFLSFTFGALIGIYLVIRGQKGLKSEIPFGPFLAGATLVCLFFQNYFLQFINYLYF